MNFANNDSCAQPIAPTERPDAMATVAAQSWNQSDMRALNIVRDDYINATLPAEFGTLELVEQAMPGDLMTPDLKIGDLMSGTGDLKNGDLKNGDLMTGVGDPMTLDQMTANQMIGALQPLTQDILQMDTPAIPGMSGRNDAAVELADYEMIYKPEVPADALRKLHQYFPKLESKVTRVALGKGSMFDHLREAHEHESDLPLDKFEWFRKEVNTGGPWDYKSFYTNPNNHPELVRRHLPSMPAPQWVQDYGNFHYGAVAFALGLTLDQALIFAGAAQQGGTEKHPVKSVEGVVAGVKNTAKAAVLPNHGDADFNDQFRIQLGYEWAKEHEIQLGLND